MADDTRRELARLASGDTGHVRLELRVHRADDRFVWCLLHLSTVRDEDGRPLYTIAQFEDITDQKAHEADLAYRAMHDVLTGLPNRHLLMDRLRQGLAQLARTGLSLAVIYLDLDGFKKINDVQGHAAGDLLLREVAQRLVQAARPSDTVARLGGDEFVIVCNNVASYGDAEGVARRVIEMVAESVAIGEHAVHVTASVGIALTRAWNHDPTRLLHAADLAMYRAKQHGRGRYELDVGSSQP
jgi:diguanylate cyclase (GGDEF)-like protein